MDAVKFLKMIGWFDSTSQAALPVHDPGMEGLCLACEHPLLHPSGEDLPPGTPEPSLKTVSLMYAEQPRRSYFYRVHAACSCRANDQKALCAIDDLGMEMEEQG